MRILEIQIFFLSGSSDKLGKRKRQFFARSSVSFLGDIFLHKGRQQTFFDQNHQERSDSALVLHFLRTCSASCAVGLMSNV